MWAKIFSWIVKITGYPVYYLLCRTKVYYVDKAVQSRRIKGNAIVVSNHRSVWDFAVMLFLFFGRFLRCIVAEVIYTRFGMNVLMPWLGSIKVDRNAPDFAFVEKSVDVLNKGGVVEIYPESRIPEDDEEKPLAFKPSAVQIALESGAPIIPVYTNGKYFQKSRARVIIGTPLDARELYDENLSHKENVEKITEILRNTVIELGYELERRTKEKNR